MCLKGEQERKLLSSLVSLLIRMLVLSNQDPTLMTPFNLNYLLRGSISKYSHTVGLGFNIGIGVGHTIQLVTRELAP